MTQDRNRLVWFEGMTLDPHHFQQWDRYQHHMVEERVRAFTPYSWGLIDLSVDVDRLRNGEFVLTRCRAVFPDGLTIDVPDTDPEPTPVNVQEAFEATQERLPVILAVPSERRDGGNVTMQNGVARRDTRFVSETVGVVDENTGSNERQIEVARPNVQVRLGQEPSGAYTTMQVAEVERTASGTFELCADFIPPSLRVAASDRLSTILRELVEKLVSKSSTFADRRDNILSQRELSPSDVTAMGLLGTVNALLPEVRHHHAARESHPERVYLTLSRLAGQLAAYTPEASVHPRDLPAYDHAHPSDTFNTLARVLNQLLGGASPRANYDRVSLQRQRENLFTADLAPDQIDEAQLFLVVRSDSMPEEKVVNELPGMLRIASPATIDAVLSSYTRALGIEHTTRLPVGIPIDAGASYFRLRKRGPFWEAVEEDGALAIFVPSNPDELSLQLLAVYTP
jgi:type VI secretion system protein ImpJ